MKDTFLKWSLAWVSTLSALLFCEIAIRHLDGFRLLSTTLVRKVVQTQESDISRDRFQKYVDSVALDKEVNAKWFGQEPDFGREDPTILPRHQELFERWGDYALYVWNLNFVIEQKCKNKSGYLDKLPEGVFVFEPSRSTEFPRYRYLPGAHLPTGVTLNRWGFRSADLPQRKGENTIRLAFVGASTTADNRHARFSYPEYIQKWLNLWAEKKNLKYRFEVINAGRDGLQAPDIQEVVVQELLPFSPDLVIYYEGANQFDGFRKHLKLSSDLAQPESQKDKRVSVVNLRDAFGLTNYSAVARRIALTTMRAEHVFEGRREPPKPKYEIVWPNGFDERNPDIGNRGQLPIPYGQVLAVFDEMKNELKNHRSELVLSSFIWMVKDGLEIESGKTTNRWLWHHLNEVMWPLTYKDIRRNADVQNRIYEVYARRNQIPFLHLDERMPKDPDLFVDAFHFSIQGTKLRAWITFQELLPHVRDRLRRQPQGSRSAGREFNPGYRFISWDTLRCL